jgi:hypothetical protein
MFIITLKSPFASRVTSLKISKCIRAENAEEYTLRAQRNSEGII